ncbi:hypothetical protein OK349_04645 [Sphingomonas sp. BT-65]|uniref:hypothetical protein n=1 Tax=Sphingomonas sp. BT-65 TaxID=2989821 RepID=UPI002235FBCD|nr:hypothetical protein [Sphingomonas sp. BT-65]MCW4460985.1 hypothetical protein [Sphingomonas sp. BT-65]
MSAVLRGLPAMDAREADLRRIVLRALTGRRVGGAVLAAHVASQPDLRGGWLRFESDAALALDRLDDLACRFEAQDGLAAAALIEHAEPLLRTIEMALGIDLEPDDIADAPPADAPIFTLAAAGLTARLALPLSLTILPAPADFAPELAAKAAVAAKITIAGPRLAPHEAAGLAPGDCLLLGGAPLRASLAAGTIRVAGSFDPRARQFRSHP